MPRQLSEDDLRLVECSLCGLDCLGESHEKVKPAQLPEEYRGWVKLGRRIAVRYQGRPRCEACIWRDYASACRESEAARRVAGEWEMPVVRVSE